MKTERHAAQKVCIIEDNPSVRESLRLLLEDEGFVAQTYGSVEELLAHSNVQPADERARHSGAQDALGDASCVLLDVRLPGASGLSLLEQLSRRKSAPPVIVISGHTDVPQAVQAMKHGAMDIIEKPFRGPDVLARVRDALALSRTRRRQQQRAAELRQRHESLSRRERQVLELVVRGLLNKQIAAELHLSTKTVECHRARVMEKMQARSLADLVRMAVKLERTGLLKPHKSQSNAATR